MTTDQVLGAFKGQAVRVASPKARGEGLLEAAEIPVYRVGSTDYRVSFLFDKGGRLAKLWLEPVQEYLKRPEAFANLEQELTNKYGQPYMRDAAGIQHGMLETQWRKDGTEIFLQWSNLPLLRVMYRPAREAPSSKF